MQGMAYVGPVGICKSDVGPGSGGGGAGNERSEKLTERAA